MATWECNVLNRNRSIPQKFYRRSADEVAIDLLGRFLVRQLEGTKLIARIVETEAYLGASDRASHAWQGRRTPRNETLFNPGGVAYVYFIYGMYYCLNAVSGDAANGDAVLIRAAEPLAGAEVMAAGRGLSGSLEPGDLTGGPGKLCQALSIDKGFDGQGLQRGPLRVAWGEPVDPSRVVAGPRIGIDYAGEAAQWPLRFAVAGNPHVSKPHPWKTSGYFRGARSSM